VGVIRLLEKLNLQVDCVAGTSMGSIVGGLYSAGYMSKEMLAWLRQCDWDQLLSDGLPDQRSPGWTRARDLDGAETLGPQLSRLRRRARQRPRRVERFEREGLTGLRPRHLPHVLRLGIL
jgi:NTE family protein